MSTSYCTTAALRQELKIGDSGDDTSLATSIAAASRQIDVHCGRSFWQDATVVAREFYADSPTCLDLLDQDDPEPAREISTVTGLIVNLDSDGDGTFETTLTISTDFVLLPRNAAADNRGFSEIRAVTNYFPQLANGRPGVQVTAKFGWPSIPDDVTKACLLQAALLFKAGDVASQGDQFDISTLPTVTALLGRFRVPPIG